MTDEMLCENCHRNEIEGDACDSIWVCNDCREKIQKRHKTAMNRATKEEYAWPSR